MRLWTLTTFYAVFLLILSGCTNTPKPKEKVKIDATLPVVTLTKMGAVADMNAIAFEWGSLADADINGVYVYKQTADKNKHILYKTINNKYVTHYVDSKVTPNTNYAYTFKTFIDNAQSKSSKVISVHSLPVLKSVSWLYVVDGMPRSAKLIWRPHTNQRVKSYIIERRSIDEDTYAQVAEIDGRLSAEYIDENLKDNTTYFYNINVKTFDGIVSSASDILKTTTKVLPKSVKNINVSTNLPKKIELSWDKSTQEDFAQYYLYRSEINKDKYILIAKLYNPEFVDKINQDGKKYKYRVSVVDKDGLESKYKQHTVVGSTLQKPKAPLLESPKLNKNNVIISWKTLDKRAVAYSVLRKQQLGWFDEKKTMFKDITKTEFIDDTTVDGATYIYKVFAIDKDSLVSKYSNEVKIEIPKIENIVKLEKNYKKNIEIQKDKIESTKDIKKDEK